MPKSNPESKPPHVRIRVRMKTEPVEDYGPPDAAAVTVAVPESERCHRNDGRKWRCKRRVMEGQTFCEIHFHKAQALKRSKTNKQQKVKKKKTGDDVIKSKHDVTKPKNVVIKFKNGVTKPTKDVIKLPEKKWKKNAAAVAEGKEDGGRCKRTDGRGWWCKRRVMEGKTLCEIHYEQGKLRQMKVAVPESLKIRRGEDGGGERVERRLRKKRALEALESSSDKGMKRMKAELIRVFLRREIIESSKKGEGSGGGEVTRDLPYGLMAIPPASPAQILDNAGGLGIKVGGNGVKSTVNRRRFRSKNIEPPPMGAVKVV